MRDGWRETTLGEVADVLRGAVWSKGDEVGGPDDQHEAVVGIGVTAAGGVINRAALKYVSGLGDKAKRLASGDTLMVMSNGNHSRIGNAYPIPDDFVGMPFSAFQAAIRVRDSGTVSPSFLSLLLGSEEHQRTFTDSAAGSTGLGNLKVTYLRAFPIALPPLDEQRRIVDLIAAVDDAVDAAEAEADTAKTARDEMLTAMLAARDGWRETTLGEVATRTIGRTPPRNDPSMWSTDTERPFVTIADLGPNRSVTAREGVSELAEARGYAKRFPAGSLLLSFKLSIGRVGVADRDVFTNEAIARLAPVDGVLRDFLAIALENVNWEELGSRAVKGKTMNKSSLDAIPITLPPPDEQRRIVATVKSVDDALGAARATAESLRTLRSNLLTVLLSGEHEIPSSYDALLGEVA